MATWIAEERIDGRSASGERVEIVVRLAVPRQDPRGRWMCTVALEGLLHKPVDIRGGGSLQALCLAAAFARQLLISFVDDGGRLTFPDSDYDFSIDASFGVVGHAR